MPGERRYKLVFCPQGDLLDGARGCEAAVFRETYGNTEAELAAEYGPYEPATRFIALTDGDSDVIGACRLIVPSAAGLKTVNDVGRAPWNIDGERAVRAVGADISSAWDVATIAVRPDRAATPQASAALYHGIVMATRANGVRWIVMMLDERARRLLAMAGFVARPIPGTGPAAYLGSPATTPLVGDVHAMLGYQRRHRPDAHRLMTLGAGLTDIAVPPLGEWVVRDPLCVPVHGAEPGLARIA